MARPDDAPLHEIATGQDIASIAPLWDRLAAMEPCYVPTFTDLQSLLRDPSLRYRMIIRDSANGEDALACFILQRVRRTYWIGERALARLPTLSATLFGSAMLGGPDARTAKQILSRILDEPSLDLIVMDDLAIDSGAFRAVEQLRWHRPTRISRHDATRRLIDLPETMEAYFATLRPSTRKALQRDHKLFAKLAPTCESYTGQAVVDKFLPRAAALSARTYQNGIGMGLIDDAVTRAHLARLADEGRLRGYLASIDGAPIAFAWGDVSHGTFYFRMTGFDPAFSRSCIGRGIVLEMIRDVIDSKACRRFDFGVRDMDYKARMSTASLDCAHVLIGTWRAKAVLAVSLDRSIDLAKRAVFGMLGRGRLSAIKKLLRRQG